MKHHRRPVIGGNWKMNTDLASAVELADDITAACAALAEKCDIILFPPFPYLQAVGKTLGHHEIHLGAQDVYYQPNGAFTGEVSTDMLLDLHATHVIVGHSERRHILGEDDELVNLKLQAAIAADLHVILCVGETLGQRTAGDTDEIVIDQLEMALEGVSPESMRRIILAYEPVWAIGTGMTAKPSDAQAVHTILRKKLGDLYDDGLAREVRIQYGGSVKAANAPDLIAQGDVDGFLVGGASLVAAEFAAIVKAASAKA